MQATDKDLNFHNSVQYKLIRIQIKGVLECKCPPFTTGFQHATLQPAGQNELFLWYSLTKLQNYATISLLVIKSSHCYVSLFVSFCIGFVLYWLTGIHMYKHSKNHQHSAALFLHVLSFNTKMKSMARHYTSEDSY